MTNHFTSYEVSRKLAEAGIVLPCYERMWVTVKGKQHLVGVSTGEAYPAYTLGELVRELPHRMMVYETNSAWEKDDIYERGENYWVVEPNGFEPIAAASTPEDAVGLALIEIRKGENDV